MEGSGNGIPHAKARRAFLCYMLVREGCFVFRGFGEKWYWGGPQRDTIGREGGRFAGTIKNHRHVCRLQREIQQSRGAVP